MSGRIEGFAPCADAESRLLILGSFPSVKSRAEGFYYGNSHNRFWKTVCAYFGEEVPSDVAGKRDFLARRHIALWDVLESCMIKGASDTSITDPVANDMNEILERADIRAIFTTGGQAQKLYDRLCYPKCGVHAERLPSTSPANCACSYEKLKEEYSRILGYIRR